MQQQQNSYLLGFMPPSIFKIYKHKLISSKQLSREYLFADWQNQTNFIIEQQLEKAILNQEVESTSFYFKFLQEIPENQFKYLLNPKAKSFFNETYNIHIDLKQYAYGPNLARQIIKAAAYAHKGKLFYFIIIGAFIRLSVSLTITFMLGDKDLHNLGGLFIGTIVFIFSQFFQIMTFMEMFLYMLNGVREMNRKIFFNQQLSYLISTQKIEDHEYRKIFPSLNLANDMSLRNWFKLRAILKDYGSKYFKRFEYLLSIIVLTQVFIFLWVFTSLYIESQIPKSLMITLLFESILTLGIILTLMWKGAQINQYDSQHQILILKNIKLIQDLGTNGGIFFIDGIEKQLNVDNFMLQQLVKYFKYDLQIPYKTVQLYCSQISDILNEGLQQLDYHIKYFPYSIMGINLQKDLLLKIIFTFLSLIATITYRFYIQ
ncbi:hypothetical protein PPERSA_08224 [Pseudocohnilembus persalinus]|uniref:Transmembrane protein n=1 Tax=Pseudocohnilembus persalinus TaxID=266149 RepID=A0A0V0QFX5_PSEPJ|nr:hypothetical protein PPERSA_08224 [Pseudocohnilembus persalinus]|eukprot:KRX01123.1 hypothetical protein PPERSA_08224 [Pseudocohnilembus persalinus]